MEKRADLCNPTRRAVLWRTQLYTVDVGGENKGAELIDRFSNK